jgi:ribosomal protein L29
MTRLKSKDIQKMGKEERMKKIEELKFELIKAKTHASKTGTSKAKEIKRTIARILTLNNTENKNSKVVENHK